MERPQKSHLAKIFLLVFFLFSLFLTPFISTSMRSSYLYFLLNLLIIVLGAEAGFLSAISKPRDEKKPVSVVVTPVSTAEVVTIGVTGSDTMLETVENKKVANVGVSSARVQGLKRCKSRPSLFFIGSCEPGCGEEEEMEVKKEVVGKKAVEEVGELSKQELFMKAEMFIGNFYKQLKMQREKSWQKLHGLYQKAF